MQRLSQNRKRRLDVAILRDQRNSQLLCNGDELTAVGTAAAGAHELQHVLRADGMLMGGKDVFGFLHQRNSDGLLQDVTAQITAEHIAKLAAARAVSGRFLSVRVLAIATRLDLQRNHHGCIVANAPRNSQPCEASSTSQGDIAKPMTAWGASYPVDAV